MRGFCFISAPFLLSPESDQDEGRLHFRYGPAEVDLPGNAEHPKEMDPALAKLRFDRFSVID
jgi:hypothetical protein